MALYIGIGYVIMTVAVGYVIYEYERDLIISIFVASIWPWLLLLAAIEKLLT